MSIAWAGVLLAVLAAIAILFKRAGELQEELRSLRSAQELMPTTSEVSEALTDLQRTTDAKIALVARGEYRQDEGECEEAEREDGELLPETRCDAVHPVRAFADFLLASALAPCRDSQAAVEVCSVSSREEEPGEEPGEEHDGDLARGAPPSTPTGE